MRDSRGNVALFDSFMVHLQQQKVLFKLSKDACCDVTDPDCTQLTGLLLS